MIDLPTGTVTLLLADVEGSTRLWETQPEVMTAAVAQLDQTRITDADRGFTAAFGPSSKAKATASSSPSPAPPTPSPARSSLQRAPPAPLRVRVGVHTGESGCGTGRLRRAGDQPRARLRALATAARPSCRARLSCWPWTNFPDVTRSPTWATHAFRDLPRPERVFQLGHTDLPEDFPPLRTARRRARTTAGPTDQLRRARARGGRGRTAVWPARLVTLTGPAEPARRGWRCRSRPRGRRLRRRRLVVDWRRWPTRRRAGPWRGPGRARSSPAARRWPRLSRTSRPTDPAGTRQLRASARARAPAGRRRCSAPPGTALLATSREPLGVPARWRGRMPSLALAEEAVRLFVERAGRRGRLRRHR